MDRRGVISTACLLASSGCIRGLRQKGSPSVREVESVDVSLAESSNVSITPTLLQASISAFETGRFNLAVTWEGDTDERIKFGNAIPFSEPNYSTEPSGLLLLPVNGGYERRDKRTWLPKTGSDGRVWASMEMVEPKLATGETVTGEWAIWGDPRHVSSIKPGTYTFENRFELGSGDDPIAWTLTVTIVQSEDDPV